MVTDAADDLSWLPVAVSNGNAGRPWWPGYTDDERPIGEDGKWLDSRALCAWMRERCEHVLVGFSMGKDSIATWHRLREYWPLENLHPYRLYGHPDIGFTNRSLAYYESLMGKHIVRIQNRAVGAMLRHGVFQPPYTHPTILGARIPDLTYPDLYAQIAEHLGIEDTTPWVAHGVRSADSPMRRMLLEKNGPWRPHERVFYPIHDWYVDDVRATLRRTGWKLPVDYRLFGRSFDGIDYRFIKPLTEHFPEDYDRLKDLFPLMPLELWRRGEADFPDDE